MDHLAAVVRRLGVKEIAQNMGQDQIGFCMRNGYYNDCDDARFFNPTWMADVSSDKLLAHMTIPGTHDSAALHDEPVLASFAKCQSLSITEQLKSGIRYFDIRLRPNNDDLHVYHGPINQHATFKSVLGNFREFLEGNPSEGILMRVYHESSDEKLYGDKSKKSFRDLVAEQLLQFLGSSRLAPKQEKVTDALKLGQIRGKVVVLQDFDGDWVDGSMHYDSMIRDSFWQIEDDNDIKKKKTKVFEHLRQANADKKNLYFTSTSGTGSKIGGPKSVSKKLNKIVQDFDRWMEPGMATPYGFGIVASDFPGHQLIEATIMMNYPDDTNSCIRLSNVADEVCTWYNPLVDDSTEEGCQTQCINDDLCSGYQWHADKENCDLIKGRCGHGMIKKTKGDWSYVSRGCLEKEDHRHDVNSCIELTNVSDEVCDWYNPPQNTGTEAQCKAQCLKDDQCSGYQFKSSSGNCDLIRGTCGRGLIKSTNGSWNYKSRGCFGANPITVRQTNCNELRFKNNEFLDRHEVLCAEGEVLKSWHLKKDTCPGDLLRIEYHCQKGPFLGALAGEPFERLTTCTPLLGRKLEYMDRQKNLNPCMDDSSALTGFHLVKEGCSGGDMRFKFTCQQIGGGGGIGHQRMHFNTGCDDVVGEGLEYLDRHPIRCPAGTALHSWFMHDYDCSGDNKRIHFTCIQTYWLD